MDSLIGEEILVGRTFIALLPMLTTAFFALAAVLKTAFLALAAAFPTMLNALPMPLVVLATMELNCGRGRTPAVLFPLLAFISKPNSDYKQLSYFKWLDCSDYTEITL
jgi:hypothetical protein